MKKNIGKNSIISEYLRIRSHNFIVGDNSIIDDFSYISNFQFTLGSFSHIGPNCCFAGGKYKLKIGNHVTISSHVSIYCQSNNFKEDLVSLHSNLIEDKKIYGDVTIEDFCGIGTHSIILPNNIIPEGVTIGAFSLVPPKFQFEKYTYYSGNPIIPKKKRDNNRILKQAQEVEKKINEKN